MTFTLQVTDDQIASVQRFMSQDGKYDARNIKQYIERHGLEQIAKNAALYADDNESMTEEEWRQAVYGWYLYINQVF